MLTVLAIAALLLAVAVLAWRHRAADRRVEQLADPTPTPDEQWWAEVAETIAPDHGYIPRQKGHSDD